MINMVIEQRRHSLGGSVDVGRVLPFAKQQMVGPFIFFDHLGPLDLAQGIDRSVDVRAHPHIGLSKDRLAQAASDWKAGRMKLPDADSEEFIPLPDQPGQLHAERPDNKSRK